MHAITFLRKIYWKLRWKVTKRPLVIRRWHHGLQISMPKSGSAAQIFYRTYSEPQIAEWMQENLKSGDSFVDIGAHVGEYCLIASTAIGPSGTIIALEPQQDLCEIISLNFSDNHIPNIRVIHGALGEKNGYCHLYTDDRNKAAVLDTDASETGTPMIDIPTLLADIPDDRRIWMKLDAAGFELPCLNACKEYLQRRPVHLILKAYHEREVRNRFPQISTSIKELLDSMGYRCSVIIENKIIPWDGSVRGYCEAVICEP